MFKTNILRTTVVFASLFGFSFQSGRADEEPKTTPVEGVAASEKSLAGRWAVTAYVLEQHKSEPFFLLDVSETAEGHLTANVVESLDGQLQWNVKSIESKDGRIRIEFESDTLQFSFDGTRRDPLARGELAMPSGLVAPSRIYSTTAATMKDFTPPPEEFASEWEAAAKLEGDARIAAIQKFVDAHPESPLALEGSLLLLRSARSSKVDVAAVEKAADKYVQLAETWGSRVAKHSRIVIADALGDATEYNALALKSLATLESSLTDADPAVWKEQIEIVKGYTLINSAEDGQRKQGAEILWKYLDKDVFNTKLTAELLQYEQTHGDIDKAIDLAARFAAFPPTGEMTEQWANAKQSGVDVPKKLKEQASALWVKKHGKEDGLEKRLDEAYLLAVKKMQGDPIEPRPSNPKNRVALIEMFTGVGCAPCLAPDIALTNIEHMLPSTELEVLRYQTNVPVADPMAILPGEQRGNFYGIKGTPSLYISGAPMEAVGGFREQVPQVERILKNAIGPVLNTPTKLQIDLTALNEDGAVVMSAAVKGLQELAYERRFNRLGIASIAAAAIFAVLAVGLLAIGKKGAAFVCKQLDAPWMLALMAPRMRMILACLLLAVAALIGYQLVPNNSDIADLRLRLALAENEISFAAPNGVRVHDSVVRAMPGTAVGIRPVNGKLAYSGRIELNNLHGMLLQQMAVIEQNFKIKFPIKPLELRHLKLVAFVQSDESREIFQVASAKVEGLPPFEKTTSNAKPAESPPKSNPTVPAVDSSAPAVAKPPVPDTEKKADAPEEPAAPKPGTPEPKSD